MERNTVGVVGAGSWGTTLAKILGDNARSTLLWARSVELCREINETRVNQRYLPGARLAETVTATPDLQRVCTSCELILLVVPSHGLRLVAREMGRHLHGGQLVVHCTKGIEQQTYRRMSEILREETCLRQIGALGGPNLAAELAAGNPAGTVVASKYDHVVRVAQAALHSRTFRVYGGSDVIGVEIGGAFKNIVAVAAGIVDGLHLGDNTKALLLTRSLSEMARLGAVMGGEVVTFGGMAGIGDLICTCASPLSRNHQVGERLARGETLADIERSMFMVAEGVRTTRALHAFARRKGIDLPIVHAVHAILDEGAAVPRAIETLMGRQVGREFVEIAL
jgi:glycerol-3-phosphate dehydrogenase (NAD(P)+)